MVENTDKYLVMIVDDDASMLSVMETQIKLLYDVVLAESGRAAYSYLTDQKERIPDIILLDINMPGMDGYELLKLIKEDESIKHIPVVFLTGMTDEVNEYKGLQMDVVDYLKKPVSSRILLARIQHYIDLYANTSSQIALDMDKINNIPEKLTEREMEVVCLMAEFRSDREIAELLHISIPYVKKLVCNIKEKLMIEKRGEIRNYFAAK